MAASRKPHDTATAALLNRTALRLAEQQRLVDSWLPAQASSAPPPGSAADGPAPANVADAPAGDAALVARSERLGLGAAPVDAGYKGSVSAGASRAEGLEALRRRIVGRKAGGMKAVTKRPREAVEDGGDGSESEEEGRADAVGRKRVRVGDVRGEDRGRGKGRVLEKQAEEEDSSAEDGEGDDEAVARRGSGIQCKQPASFLDEAIAERRKKKKKKKKKKRKKATDQDES